MTLLRINTDGSILSIYNDDLLGLMAQGTSTISRASHVEPAPEGGWAADLAPVGGPLLSGFTTRKEALAAEVTWLEENVITKRGS